MLISLVHKEKVADFVVKSKSNIERGIVTCIVMKEVMGISFHDNIRNILSEKNPKV